MPLLTLPKRSWSLGSAWGLARNRGIVIHFGAMLDKALKVYKDAGLRQGARGTVYDFTTHFHLPRALLYYPSLGLTSATRKTQYGAGQRFRLDRVSLP